MSTASSGTLPTRTLANIIIPDTPLLTAAIDLARETLRPFAFNHVMRSLLYGSLIASQRPSMITSDPQNASSVASSSHHNSFDHEVHAVAAVLHDLGWDRHQDSSFVSEDKRFEVDGANAARRFILENTTKQNQWDDHRVQLVLDSIALHTTPSIAMYKQPEVAITAMGISADFLGTKFPGGAVTKEVYEDVAGVFPYEGFRDGVNDTVIWLCRCKAETTFDSFARDFGLRYVDGYKEKAEGKAFIDAVLPLAGN